MLKTMESRIEANEPQWLKDKRLAALELFRKTPMPNFIYGLNINLNIDMDLENISTSEAGAPIKEIINSNKNISIKKFSNDPIFKENFMTTCVPKNTKASAPVEIITKINSKVVFDHLIIIAEENSELILVEELKSYSDDEAYVSKIVEVFAGKNAKIDYGNLQLLNNKTFQFVKKRAVTKNNSSVSWLDCCFGSSVTLSEVTTYLNGEGSQADNYGIFFGNQGQQFDLVAKSIHKSPNTVSDIFTKGALTGASKCIYRGLVKIQRNAPGCNGYQKEDTLLLSPDAAADSIPDLEIDNSDVRCTHGASIGRIDREKLFYLKSRGLDENQATKTYVKGFFEELIQKMQIAKLRDNMHELVDERME
jgi:Fe-S cluster assembly protein SufD